jgi:hypothetical protein
MNEEDFTGMRMPPQQQMPRPISTADVLECRPDDAWLLVEDGLAGCRTLRAALPQGEDAKAFPYIESLAKSHRDKARPRVSARLAQPRSERGEPLPEPLYWFYGFEQRAEHPLTLEAGTQPRRAGRLGRKLRALNVGELNEELLAKAFTTSHSTAEVYRLESVEKVFGC